MTKTNETTKNYSHIWKTQRDQQGLPPLKHEHKLHSDTKIKANLFNQQFSSVFTPKEPLSLSHLAKMRVQDLKTAGGLPSDTRLTTWLKDKDARDRHLKKWST